MKPIIDVCCGSRMLAYREKNREKRNKYQREWAHKVANSNGEYDDEKAPFGQISLGILTDIVTLGLARAGWSRFIKLNWKNKKAEL